VNPPRIKRQFRDPHGDWWDKQERRNFGEPVHEDHDMMGMFTPYEYTWVSPGKGLMQIGIFVSVFVSVCYAVSKVYPDRVSYPREFEGGLEKELGGAGAIRVRRATQGEPWRRALLTGAFRRERPTMRPRRFRCQKRLYISYSSPTIRLGVGLQPNGEFLGLLSVNYAGSLLQMHCHFAVKT